MLMALLLVTGDFITISLATDRARPSPLPDVWRVRDVTAAAAVLGLCKLLFSLGALALGRHVLELDAGALQTFTFVTLVFGSQATVYVVRERGHLWHSRPGGWLVLSSLLDLAIAAALALGGLLLAPLPVSTVVGVLLGAVAFALVLDSVKTALFPRLRIAWRPADGGGR
jgi:H+-transporting ATPase